jgi:hypothetical protein
MRNWRDAALCITPKYRDLPWFPDRGGTTAKHLKQKTRLVCKECPVIVQCDQLAHEVGATAGIWAGRNWAGIA